MQRVEAADYRDIVQVSDPQLSTDGERVAFVRTVPKDGTSYDATVHVVPIGGDGARAFTVAEGVDSEPRYSPSGDRLAFVSTRGVDDDRPQLWILPTDGGEARQVTDVAGGVSDIAWSPDGSRVAFAQRTTPAERERGLDLELTVVGESGVNERYEREPPDPRVIDRLVYRTGTDYFDDTRSHLYAVDSGGGSVERLTPGGERDFANPEWGTESELYYTVCRELNPDDTARYDIEALDVETGAVETIVETSSWDVDLAATDDGRVAYPHASEERLTLRQTEIRIHDRSTGETHEPTAALDRTLDVAAGIEWAPGNEQCYFATPGEGTVVLRRVAWDGDDVETVVRGGHLTGFSVGEHAVAYVQSEWDHRGDVFVATRGGSEVNRLTRVNADYLDGRAVREPEAVKFESEPGVEV